MFSINKIIWLIIILAVIWYAFKFFEKKNKNSKKEFKKDNSEKKNKNSKKEFKKDNSEKKNIDAFKCPACGLWSADKICNNEKCTTNS